MIVKLILLITILFINIVISFMPPPCSCSRPKVDGKVKPMGRTQAAPAGCLKFGAWLRFRVWGVRCQGLVG